MISIPLNHSRESFMDCIVIKINFHVLMLCLKSPTSVVRAPLFILLQPHSITCLSKKETITMSRTWLFDNSVISRNFLKLLFSRNEKQRNTKKVKRISDQLAKSYKRTRQNAGIYAKEGLILSGIGLYLPGTSCDCASHQSHWITILFNLWSLSTALSTI